jgi:hypothetical protein
VVKDNLNDGYSDTLENSVDEASIEACYRFGYRLDNLV